MPTDRCNDICNTNYESFKILRGVPLCNSKNPAQNNVWFAAIQGPPGKIHDPCNYISYTQLDNSRARPISQAEPLLTLVGHDLTQTYSPDFSNQLIVDSTRIIVQNLINNNFIDINQEDAFCTFVSNEACSAPSTISACYNPKTCVDGVLQFLALISISPTCTVFMGTGLLITISPLASNCLFSSCTFGNWCPISFSIGNCKTQSATASLLYLTCPAASGYGYSYSANYANVRFTLLNKAKCATGGSAKACYLGVDSLDKQCFLVFFGQQRLIGTAQILLISPIVDLKCIIWQPVFIVTTNTPLSLLCGPSP